MDELIDYLRAMFPNNTISSQITFDGSRLIRAHVMGDKLGDNGRYPVIATYTADEIERMMNHG